jgi:ERCC4-type nuclease
MGVPRANQEVRILADHREAVGGVLPLLATMEGVTVAVEQLDVADYVLSARLAVERKSSLDFAASIVDRRLFGQAERLRERYERVVYLIEGAGLYEGHNLHPNAVRGALSFLTVLSGATVLRTEGPEDSAQLLATMARHEQHGLGYAVSSHRVRRSARVALQQRYVVEQLPGIGPKTAHALLEWFGTLAALFAADEEALRQVPGIGPKRARAVHALIAAPYVVEDDTGMSER